MVVKIQDALKLAVERIERTNAVTPLLDAEVLLCHVLKKERLFLYTHRNKSLSEEAFKAFEEFVEKRIAGMPVQYIVKKQEFMGLDFYVEEGVLIPRPDTEILVEAVIKWANNRKNDNITIVDIGTGSGAITVSLAKYIKNAFVYSIDISRRAITIGKKNAVSNGVAEKIEFLEGDLFTPLKNKLEGKVDILVSNPPYIPKEEIDKLQIEVKKYEPRLALDGGTDGLDFYRRIIDEAPFFVKKGGYIALEVGHDQAELVKELMENKGLYTEINKIKDLAGIERVVVATL
ncbi:peptide chain release factor N(5)-glutamine methyltransferase [Crassaminicella indica]|uniref:peptide chain release factor N(5)-glutamine methyltransferase n=1 Tax=Crassaminicella indica TaxID=2855394 RepID=UPI002104F27A|nr:peptide chain release factor N(5)-glutamine methyltransferase [Crassaminicella indica]